MNTLSTDAARLVWDSRYRHRLDGRIVDRTPQATWRRVASALAAVEGDDARALWEQRFYALMRTGCFIPGGRVLAGAGVDEALTLLNCFAAPTLEDAEAVRARVLEQALATLRHGGGVGCDFSTLRPRGLRGAADAAPGTGPVAEMRRWDAAVRVESAAGRRGAMMATLRCDHPDIEHFIEAKRAGGALTCFNLSVLVTDAFLQAVAHDREWPLLFPAAALAPGGGGCVERRWSGESVPVPCRVLRVVAARALWQRFVQAACDAAEPGIVFLDRVNAENNLGYCEHIDTTNPCGEIPLPPDGACDLGSLVLPRYVTRPFAADAALDYAEIERVVGVAVRLLDNVIDVSRFALPAQAERARGARRIGIGVTGLADALVMLGLAYGSDAAVAATGALMRRIRDAAYRASSALAVEKGAFPRFDADSYLAAPFVARLPRPLRAAIARDGIRNSHLLAVAPAGTISLLAGNVSSGIEPVFRARYRRALRGAGGDAVELELEDHACRLWRESGGAGLPPAYVDAAGLAPAAHLAMQAAVQRYVDNAVSKTIHLGGSATAADVEEIFFRADALGLKGCTVYRPSALRGEVLRAAAPGCSGAGETP